MVKKQQVLFYETFVNQGYRPVFQGRSAANNKEVKPDEADKSSVASRLNGGAVRFGDK